MTPRRSTPPGRPQTRRKPHRILACIGAAAASAGMLTAISLPASAATTRSAAPDSPAVATTTAARDTPDASAGLKWFFINYFSSHSACESLAQWYEVQYFSAYCSQTQEYDLVVWALYALLPVG
jgi:hypothetical protein